MTGEDAFLEAAYEDRNGGDVDTASRDDEEEDYIEDCPVCGDPIDYCLGGHTPAQLDDFEEEQSEQ